MGAIKQFFRRYSWLINSKGWLFVLAAIIMFSAISFFCIAAGLMALFPWIYGGIPMYELTSRQRLFITEEAVWAVSIMIALFATHLLFKGIDGHGGTGPDGK